MVLHLRYARCLVLGIAGLSAAGLRAQADVASGSWLDAPLKNWNLSGKNIGAVPDAPVVPASNLDSEICRKQVRLPKNKEEAELVHAGWKLYGKVQQSGALKVVMGMTDADGMCRPLGYQVFVFVQGRYAGTLSPVPMNSRSDGALSEVHLYGTDRLSADFLRYKDSDPLCCASSTSTVEFAVQAKSPRSVAPLKVSTRSNSAVSSNLSIEGPQWGLTELGGEAVPAAPSGAPMADLKLDSERHQVSGSSGCNRYSGTYRLSGTHLSFGDTAGTMMACLSGMDIEKKFLQMLQQVRGWKEEAGEMVLLDSSGASVARFRAVP